MARFEFDRFSKIAGRVSLFLSCAVLLAYLNPASAQSQPISPVENGTNTRVNRNGNRFNITGGRRSRDGVNLFHDFERFGLNANQIANFRTNPEIRNILGRISGGDISVINGLIQVRGGNSNLYLLNPAGIIFGPNARLNVPAAFAATTADGIRFDNGWFSAVGDNNYAALVGDPNGFAFTMSNPGTIINAGNLAVAPGQQLTLLGGTVISTGTLSAPGGEITIATVPGENLVRISQEGYLLNLELPLAEGRNREDLLPNVLSFNPLSLPELLTGGSVRNATGAIVTSDGTVRLTGSGLGVRGGDVVAQAVTAETATLSADRNLTLAGSQLQTTDDLSLLAQDTVRVRDTTTSPFNAQAGGDLYVRGDRQIEIFTVNSQPSFQSGGSLSLVSDSFRVNTRLRVGGDFSVVDLWGRQPLEHSCCGIILSVIRSDAEGNITINFVSANNEEPSSGGSFPLPLSEFPWLASLLVSEFPLPVVPYIQSNDRISYNQNSIEESSRLKILVQRIRNCFTNPQFQENDGPSGIVLEGHANDYIEAIECYQQNLAIARHSKSQQEERNILQILALISYALGDYNATIDYYHQLLIIAQSITNSPEEVQALVGLGAAYIALGNYEKAVEHFQQSFEIVQLLDIPTLKVSVLSSLGLVYYALKDYNKALELQQQSLEIAKQLQDKYSERLCLSNLGLVYFASTDYTKAIELQQQSLEIARSLQDKLGEQRALENLGIAYYALEDYEQAAEYQRQSLRIAREIGDRHAEGRTLNNLGDALYQAGYFQEATEALLGAIEIWESLRENLGGNDLDRISIFETHETTYSTLQELLVQQGQFNQALEIIERGRAQAFVELLAERTPLHSAETEHLEDLNSERTPPSIQQLQRIAQEQNSTLVSYSIMKQVKDDSGVRQLEDSELYIWVIQPTGETAFRQVDLKFLNQSLGELVAETRDAIRVGGRGENQLLTLQPEDLVRREGEPDHWQPYEVVAVDLENETVTLRHPDFSLPGPVPLAGVYRVEPETHRQVESHFRQLDQLLIEPIADLLPNNPEAHVTFIPHGELFLVPFAVLQDQEGQHLIEKHTILTAPSIQVLDFTYQRRQQLSGTAQGGIVIGNPSPMPQDLAPLPYAEEEAKAVASLLHTTPLIGAEATETVLRQHLSDAQVIHLATYGTFNEENLLQGAIALAPSGIGEAHDGWFTAAEILEYRLNAELVVLNACNTGRGKITGDGVIGLSRSLIAAGTPSVVVSLWQVPDDATADLMQEFYRNWQQYSDKAQALRQAMLTMMRTYPNPHNWAAFTLVGEAE